jgi:hypothetical protein
MLLRSAEAAVATSQLGDTAICGRSRETLPGDG